MLRRFRRRQVCKLPGDPWNVRSGIRRFHLFDIFFKLQPTRFRGWIEYPHVTSVPTSSVEISTRVATLAGVLRFMIIAIENDSSPILRVLVRFARA